MVKRLKNVYKMISRDNLPELEDLSNEANIGWKTATEVTKYPIESSKRNIDNGKNSGNI